MRPTEHIARPLPAPFCFCPHATRQTRLSASGLSTDAYRYATPFFISHALRETYTQVRRKSPYTPAFTADTAVRRPVLPLSAPSIPASCAGERISLCSRFMWNIRLVIRQNLNIYRGFCSFMHIYTLRHCMFFAYAFAFSAPAILFPLPLRGWRSRLGAAPPLLFPSPASPPGLAVFVGARLHSVFPRSYSLFFDFSISFCLMPHGAPQTFCLFFLCLRLFALSLRGSAPHLPPSLIRLCLKRSPLPNLSILLDTVLLLLYNYLAFACESPLFVYYWLYKATRSDRPSAVRSVEQRHKTTTK